MTREEINAGKWMFEVDPDAVTNMVKMANEMARAGKPIEDIVRAHVTYCGDKFLSWQEKKHPELNIVTKGGMLATYVHTCIEAFGRGAKRAVRDAAEASLTE